MANWSGGNYQHSQAIFNIQGAPSQVNMNYTPYNVQQIAWGELGQLTSAIPYRVFQGVATSAPLSKPSRPVAEAEAA